MKTTVEISDDLWEEAKKAVAAEKTSLRSLIEEGLRWALARRRKPRQFRLKDRSVSGKGPQTGIREGAWEEIRDLVYRGRGA